MGGFSKVLFVCIAMLAVHVAYAQQWAPNDAVWYYGYQTYSLKGYTKVQVEGDTLLQGKNCKIISKTIYGYDDVDKCIR